VVRCAVKENDNPIRHRIQNYTKQNGGDKIHRDPGETYLSEYFTVRVTYISVIHKNLIQLQTTKSRLQVSLFHLE